MSERGSIPARPSQTPGLPSNPFPIPFEVFEGLNTHVPRASIKDTEMAICDGWVPFGPSYLRTIWDHSPAFYTAPGGLTIEWFGWANLQDAYVVAILLSDGSLQEAFGAVGGSVTIVQIAPPGTILAPSNILGFSQWGSQYLMFAAPQTNGYWLWDGINLFTAGTISPVVTITNAGENYTSAPSFSVATNGGGSGFGFSATLDNGSISNIHVTNPGSGFAVGDLTVLSITGGGSDNTAIASASIGTGGGLSGVQVIDGGLHYSASSYATVTGGGGSGASVALQAQAGVITGITIVSAGSGYTSPPTIGVTDPSGTGSGFSATAELSGGQIGSLFLSSGGTNYVTPPVVTIVGDGTGATAFAQISGGVVTNLVLSNAGFGYSQALVQFSGGNNGASATLSLMPFGVSGTAIEVAFSRVWVTNGAAPTTPPPLTRTVFSAAGDPTNFAPSQGAGAFLATDSFVRVGYHALKQTNGFLYLIGDSSLNYISGVNTSSSGTPPVVTTTFTNTNADPQTGSPWPSSTQVYQRNIVMANPTGVYVSYGGAVTKISDDLDGIYNTVIPAFSPPDNRANYPSAVADLYGAIRCYILLLPIVDQVTGIAGNKLLIWNGKKWVTTSQSVALTYIATQEYNSAIIAWGTDGNSLYPLFTNPSTNVRKTVQSKLWANPGYYYTKQMMRFLGIFQNKTGSAASIAVTSDTENNSSGLVNINLPPGLDVVGPVPIGNSGRLQGLTVQTNAADMAMLSMTMIDQIFETNI